MNIIGRERERDILSQCLESKKPEFLVVFGRRRVGKTFLIRNFFNERFSFYTTGIPDEKMRNQLKVFNESLVYYGDKTETIPKDWFEAFRRLRALLESDGVVRDAASGKELYFWTKFPGWIRPVRTSNQRSITSGTAGGPRRRIFC